MKVVKVIERVTRRHVPKFRSSFSRYQAHHALAAHFADEVPPASSMELHPSATILSRRPSAASVSLCHGLFGTM